jgi:hypothetical protein
MRLLRASIAEELSMNLPDMRLGDWIALVNLGVTFATLVILAWIYRRISESQIDDNIINATNSILTLLEKAKALTPGEKHLLVDWLDGWDYFDPPRFVKKRRPLPTKETVDNLSQYFKELGGGDQSSPHNQ